VEDILGRCLEALVLGGGEGGTGFEFDEAHVVSLVECEVIAAHCVRLYVGGFAKGCEESLR
jgi:hypothetical protein